MYQAEISRSNPALILFLFDCSYSMSEKYGDTGISKGEYLARVCNEAIDQVILSCEKGDELRAYFEIGIIGYGGTPKQLLPIDTVINLANNPTKMITSEIDGVKIERPIWIEDPTDSVNTDMKAGFEMAAEVLQQWIDSHKSSFPPVLIHVSDGEWTEGSPIQTAQKMQTDIFTDDGPVIIMNIHISEDSDKVIVFPDAEPTDDEFQKGLFNMSTVMPDQFLSRAKEIYPSTVAGARSYKFNAQPDDLSKYFDIGTRLKG